jgi:hypothetical protein
MCSKLSAKRAPSIYFFFLAIQLKTYLKYAQQIIKLCMLQNIAVKKFEKYGVATTVIISGVLVAAKA